MNGINRLLLQRIFESIPHLILIISKYLLGFHFIEQKIKIKYIFVVSVMEKVRIVQLNQHFYILILNINIVLRMHLELPS